MSAIKEFRFSPRLKTPSGTLQCASCGQVTSSVGPPLHKKGCTATRHAEFTYTFGPTEVEALKRKFQATQSRDPVPLGRLPYQVLETQFSDLLAE